MRNLLIYLSFKYEGNNFYIWKALKQKEKINLDDVNLFLKTLEQEHIKVTTIYDDDYPEVLKKYDALPYVIFYKGDLNILNNKIIALSGDSLDENSLNFLNNSLPIFSKNNALIIGSYKALEKNIIEYYRKNDKHIIHVLASGFDFFNQEIKENELYITQYPIGCNIKFDRLREKNSIIAKIAESLVIYNSNIKSSIQNMVTYFTQYGKEVYCYPSLNENDGNFALIRDGAQIIENSIEICYYL
ncbi:DNA-processing protein DprA [Mycoplasmopsis lipophila]|uniref:DNA-processing protein DprA n=1 Tax=Mycoplasmopsis lipophila TaxID=2117 RepID=UPI003873CA8B